MKSSSVFYAALAAAVLTASPAMAKKVSVNTGARLLPTSAVLVGTYDSQQRPDAAVIDRIGIADTRKSDGVKKMIFYVSVRPSRTTSGYIDASGAFTVNFPGADLLAGTDYCGKTHALTNGKYHNKLEAAGLKYEKSATVNAPVLTDCPVVFECKVTGKRTFAGGSHIMYEGEVVSYLVDDKVMLKDGKDPVKEYSPRLADTIALFNTKSERGGYYTFSDSVGSRGLNKTAFPDSGLKK